MSEATARYVQRVEAFRRRLAEAGVEAMVVVGRENRRYLTGFIGSAGLLVVGADGRLPMLLTDGRYTEQARRQTAGLVDVVQHGDRPLEDLKTALAARGYRHVGFESELLSYQQARRWQEEIADVHWIPLERQVESLRAIKDAGELDALRRAVALTDAGFEFLRQVMRPGLTEQELAWRLEVFLREHGAERLAFDSIVAAGPNGALPHAMPGERALAPGDLVVLDFGAVVDGYCADMTRTVAVGREIAPRLAEIYEVVRQAQQAAVDALRPGMTGAEADQAARQVIEAAGYGEYFGHGLGHGVGLEVHEPIPRLSRVSDVVLQPGMVCSVEPGIYLPGLGGVRIEDLVVITAQGCEVLTRSPKERLHVGV